MEIKFSATDILSFEFDTVQYSVKQQGRILRVYDDMKNQCCVRF